MTSSTSFVPGIKVVGRSVVGSSSRGQLFSYFQVMLSNQCHKEKKKKKEQQNYKNICSAYNGEERSGDGVGIRV